MNRSFVSGAKQSRFNNIQRYWILWTECRRQYVVDISTMGIIQYDRFMQGQSPSNSWRLIGFKEVKPFGNMSGTIEPQRFTSDDIRNNMRFKNGKGRYYVVDYDHGTQRIWGDRAVGFVPFA